MKRFTFILLSYLILISCASQSTSNSGNNRILSSDSIKQHFIPIINGVWVLTDYITEIERTKSPFQSMHKLVTPNLTYLLDEIVTMVINVADQSDSVIIGASINNHEEYFFTIYFQSGQNNNGLKTNILDNHNHSVFYELSYQSINSENYLFLNCYDETSKLIGKRQFSKVADEQKSQDVAWGIQYIVNKKLFSGKFLLTDTANITTSVKFNHDDSRFSTVIGLPEFAVYYIITDFIGDIILLDVDVIIFLNDRNDVFVYAFQIDEDAVCLYSVILHEEARVPLELDELKYKLVREK